MTQLLREALANVKSLRAVERATGVTNPSLVRFIRGDQSLRLDMADRLAAYFSIECRQAKAKGADMATTKKGYVNKNKQENLGCTGHQGTDHFQYVYAMKCQACGHTYGANGSDIFQRKCPNCQGGKPGI